MPKFLIASDTDSPNVVWESAVPTIGHSVLPTAADLDAVAEEQRLKEKTGANRSD